MTVPPRRVPCKDTSASWEHEAVSFAIYQAKITEQRARRPPNFVELPRNLFQNFGAPRSRPEIPEWFDRPYLRPYSVVAL
jgi:hypothetical protein